MWRSLSVGFAFLFGRLWKIKMCFAILNIANFEWGGLGENGERSRVFRRGRPTTNI